MKPAVRGAAAVVGTLGLLAGLIVSIGLAPVRASSGHWPPTQWLLQFTKTRSVATQSLGVEPPPLDDLRLTLIGAGHYETGCRMCHGAPGAPLPAVLQAATPPPPNLADVVPRYSATELFFIVRHGIKFTGMPAWPASGRDDEVWAVIAFLQRYPSLTASDYYSLVYGNTETPSSATLMRGGGHTVAKHSNHDEPTAPPTVVVERCARCHGQHGHGRSDAFPKLAQQKERYLHASLDAYADGERHSGIMQPIAAALTARQRSEAAAWYAKQGRHPLRGSSPILATGKRLRPLADAGAETDDEEARLQSEVVAVRDPSASHQEFTPEVIVQQGIPERKLPPCIECHHPQSNSAYPLLEGQPAPYLQRQLELFAQQQRGGTRYSHLMHKVAIHSLSSAEQRAIAEYYSARTLRSK